MSISTTRSETGNWAGFTTIAGGTLLAISFLVDAVAGFTTTEGIPGSTEWIVGYGLLAVAAFLLAAGLAGIAAGFRRRIGTDTVVGLTLGALGYLLVAVGSALNAVYQGAAGDTTLGGGIVFPGFLVVALAVIVTSVALWRHDIARTASIALIAGIVVFIGGFIIGPTVMDAVGFDLVYLVAWLLIAAGWMLFGNAVRSGTEPDTTDRVTPVA